MRLEPRGVRGRAVLATVAATIAVAAVLGLVSAFLVMRVAQASVEEVVDSRLSEVRDALTDTPAGDSLAALSEVTEEGHVVEVVVRSAAGVERARTPGMPAGLDPCNPGEDYVSAQMTVDTVDGEMLVCGAASSAPVERAQRDLLKVLLILLPLVVAGVAAAVWLAVGRALGSVEKLRRQAAAMTDTREGLLQVEPTGDEIERLGHNLNDLLARLHAQSRAVRQFVADAGHELRNPLATLRVALEFDREPGAPESLALSELARLEALVQDLLVLARTDAQDAPEHAEVELAAIVADSVRAAKHADEAVHMGELPEAVLVLGDERGLRSAVDNLVSNARRHRRDRVDVSMDVTNGWVTVRVDDDGAGLEPGQTDMVFERFVRLDDSRVRDSGGSGLGLAIVRSVARAHGGDATATPGPGGHFSLRLPILDSARRQVGDAKMK